MEAVHVLVQRNLKGKWKALLSRTSHQMRQSSYGGMTVKLYNTLRTNQQPRKPYSLSTLQSSDTVTNSINLDEWDHLFEFEDDISSDYSDDD